MYLIENLLLPILSNIISPIILFLLASLVMRNNAMSRFIAKIYTTVKEGLELNTEEVPDAEDTEQFESAGIQSVKVVPKGENKESCILQRTSKNYGADSKNGWKIRTFYIFTKKQLFDKEFIHFEVKDKGFDIYLKTADLIKHFNLNDPQEEITDGADKIRAYIFQNNNDENYIVRFGKNILANPIKIVS
ncbi:hypothetical protein [Streptococcus dysgalactiae]|uniref:hypothetical protein n=1 Tax=Streptococcus dysgalactiae TaxID=1334 RepID=UPI0001AAB6B2|nr:hypothetical protein [Streptococcus dysgalactiae]OCX05000.1 hypothetical protein BBG09_02960 [Streptococcus dysgalactiae subsp. equisimilis]BAH80818.1 hypothetical protein SDEG_0303 [Streptococcus dysgalactiae subsp. equisimilis GGS_124]VTY24329.1 Uncharacterised protein [Streptococcus dysgalactiae]